MLKRFIFILTSVLLFSCGKSVDEKTASAVLSANIYLSKGNCQSAINVLEANGRVDRDAHYLKVLSSAYACRAGFSAVTFFASDLALTGSPAPLGGTTLYSTSLTTTSSPLESDDSFSDLQTAIDILLYAGGIPATRDPTASERARYFTSDEAGEINSQLLFMMFAQLGKYMHVYGNGDALGKKGANVPAGNKCFTSYDTATSKSPIIPADCKVVGGSPHAELAIAAGVAVRKTRLCQGVVILNGILNILPSVIASASGQLATQTAALTVAAGAATLALRAADPDIGVVTSTVNQSICENEASVPVAELETYFSYMYESLFLP